MVDSKATKVLTRQTADIPAALMEHVDAVKRRRGFRSFGAYVIDLVRRDMAQTGIIQTDDTKSYTVPQLVQVQNINDFNGLTPELSGDSIVSTEAQEWAALASVASRNPSEMHRTLYRNFRFAMETLAGVAREVLGLDLKIPVRFAEDGTITRPYDDPESPMYVAKGSGRVGPQGAGDHRGASADEAGGHARPKKRRA